MSLHILGDHVMQALIAATASIDCEPEYEPLKILEQQDADEGQPNDDQNEHQVQQHKDQSVLLLEKRVGHQIVTAETDNDEYDRHNQLVDRDAHIFQLLYLDANFILRPPVQVE